MHSGNREIDKWKPGVPRNTLLLIAGLMWVGVGIMLDGLAYSWLRAENTGDAIIASVTGSVCALVIHHFGFLRLVDKNLARILPMEGKQCVFSFIPWKSYIIIIIIMVALGFLLRHSPVPKLYLSVLYIGIGTALILSSVRYLRHLILAFTGKEKV